MFFRAHGSLARVAAAACVLLCASFIVCSPKTEEVVSQALIPGALDVRVMSFNIRYGSAPDGANAWKNRKELVFQTIRDFAPDVVGIQEGLRFQINQIKGAIPGYGVVGVGRDGGTKGEHSAIFYRTARFDVDESGTFWLSDTPDVPSSHWGNAYIRICTWARLVAKSDENSGTSAVDKKGACAFYIFNTHLDNRSQPSREKAVRMIASRIASRAHPDAVVLTGDLNAGERSPAVRYLLGGDADASPADASPVPLVDSFRALHPDAIAAGTFHWFTGIAPFSKIDYVLVPPDAQVLEAEIIRKSSGGRFPSDHFPVTARIRLALPSTK